MTANIKQIIFTMVVSLVLVGGLAWWVDERSSARSELLLNPDAPALEGPVAPEEQEIIDPGITNTMNPIATIETNQGNITLELFADQMPVTVGNFVDLANKGFYNDTKFHRVIPNFMIQGGDPNTRDQSEMTWGTGGPGYAIADEHVAGELLTNSRGTIAMANSGPNSGGSQWFINLVDNSYLDFDKQPLQSKHPVFGRVTEGIEIVDAIGNSPTKERDVPVEPIVITAITITEG